jgi:hypothetical protein
MPSCGGCGGDGEGCEDVPAGSNGRRMPFATKRALHMEISDNYKPLHFVSKLQGDLIFVLHSGRYFFLIFPAAKRQIWNRGTQSGFRASLRRWFAWGGAPESVAPRKKHEEEEPDPKEHRGAAKTGWGCTWGGGAGREPITRAAGQLQPGPLAQAAGVTPRLWSHSIHRR